jgi:predicted RNA-binding protein with PIN domain
MAYLIDGYNLLYAIGALHGRAGPHGLEKARTRLLGLLHGALGPRPPETTVVFDAAHAPPGAAAERDDQGIHVRFAIDKEQADDLIEELIERRADPRHLCVVSDDHRIQQAARRRHCRALGCLDFFDELHHHRRQRLTTAPAEKEAASSPADTERWLRAFADLADDPGFKELFDPYDFREPDQTQSGGENLETKRLPEGPNRI